MAEKNAPTAIERVLCISELLEAIFVRLSEHDILYNAQRVSLTWKSCIQNSKSLQQICWLRPVPIQKGTDPLFLPLNSLFEIGWIGKVFMSELQQELGGCNSTPRAIAKAFADGKIELHRYCFACMVRSVSQATCEQVAENERDRQTILENCPVEDWQRRLNDQLDRNNLHPILNNLNHISHFWTGYGNHVILAIDEGYLICYRQVAEIMEALVFLQKTEPPKASWRRAYITRPACTKVTVTGRKMEKWYSLSQSFECDTGITVEMLLRVIVTFSERYIASATEDLMKNNGLRAHIKYRKSTIRAVEDYAALDLLRLENLSIDEPTQ